MKKNSEATWTEIYDGQQNPTIRTYTVTEYASAVLEVTTYDFYVTARNWVGTSDASTTYSHSVAIDTSPTNSQISGDGYSGFEAAVDAQVLI